MHDFTTVLRRMPEQNLVQEEWPQSDTCRIVLPQSQLLTHNEPCSGSATNVVDSVDNASVERRLLERLLALDYLIDIYPVGISLLRYSHEDAANDNIEFIRDEDGQHGIVAGHKDGNIEIDWLHDEPSGTSAFTFVQKQLRLHQVCAQDGTNSMQQTTTAIWSRPHIP